MVRCGAVRCIHLVIHYPVPVVTFCMITAEPVILNVCTAPHHTALGKIQYRTNGNYRTLPSIFRLTVLVTCKFHIDSIKDITQQCQIQVSSALKGKWRRSGRNSILCLSFWFISARLSFMKIQVKLYGFCSDKDKWAATWQNQQNECAPSDDSVSVGIAQSDQSLRRALSGKLRPKVSSCGQRRLIRLGGCPDWSESSLGAHSFCWFCHVAAQLWAVQGQVNPKSRYSPSWANIELVRDHAYVRCLSVAPLACQCRPGFYHW